LLPSRRRQDDQFAESNQPLIAADRHNALTFMSKL
jgi:hypothetical protein